VPLISTIQKLKIGLMAWLWGSDQRQMRRRGGLEQASAAVTRRNALRRAGSLNNEAAACASAGLETTQAGWRPAVCNHSAVLIISPLWRIVGWHQALAIPLQHVK